MTKERGSFLTRFMDKIDAPVPNKPAIVEAQRIKDKIESLSRKEIPSMRRKDIPELLRVMADQDDKNLGVIRRTPNRVSTRIDGKRVSITNIDRENKPLRVYFGGERNVVYDPNIVGDILAGGVAKRKRENLDNRK